MAEIKHKRKASKSELDAIFRSVMRYKPDLTHDGMMELESQFSRGNIAVARRLGLAAAKQDGAWFKRLSKDREMAVSVSGQLEAIESGAVAMQELSEMMRAAAMRCRVALCNHEDVDAIVQEGLAHAVLTLPSVATNGVQEKSA